MDSGGSITRCIGLLRQGNAEAARVIWQRYFPRLVRLARERLAGTDCMVADEEDVALSALDRFCRAAHEGHFPDLADRNDLWRLLLRITTCRARDLVRHEHRMRRGGARPAEEAPRRVGTGDQALAGVTDDFPTPEFAAIMAEQCRILLERLQDPVLQAVALAKMEGRSNEEIAEKLECSVRTIERRLKLIRDVWRSEEPK